MLQEAQEALAMALAYAGDELKSASIERVEPRHEGEIYGFNVTTRDLEHEALMFVDTSTLVQHPDSDRIITVTNAQSGRSARVWTYPFDPDLPTLPAATVPDGAAVLLERLGMPTSGTQLYTVSYRPGRRAVVRCETGQATVYLKIVRPSQVESIVNLHRDFRSAGLPVPAVIAWSPEGLILLETLPGEPLANLLPQALASQGLAAELTKMISHIRTVQTEHAARGGSLERIDWYADMLANSLPQLTDRIQGTAALIARWLPSLATRCVRHGDLHADQIMVSSPDAEHVVGLLDIDTAGVAGYDTDGSFFIADLLVRRLSDDPLSPVGDNRRAATMAAAVEHFGGVLKPHPVLVGAQLLAHALGPAVHSDAEQVQRGIRLFETAEALVSSAGEPPRK